MIRKILLVSAAAMGLALSNPVAADDRGDEASEAVPALSVPKIEYSTWTLNNGLTVIALPDPTTSTVTTSVWYAIGSKHDPEARAGFSHLIEHIISRKTRNMPYNLIYDLTADVGGTRNASNWVDRTNYWEQVPAEYLETMLWTHRERMANVVIDEQVFETERGVVIEELRERVLAPPYGRLQRFILPENAYDVMPHRRPGIGSIADLEQATLDDARAFYEAYYGPGTATLIVAGNFEEARLRELVDTYFADIPPRANPVDPTITLREPARTAPRTVNATAPNVPLPVVGGVWKAPPFAHPDSAALEMLEAVLSRGTNNRLNNALVRTGYAFQVSAGVQQFREAGQIAVYALVRDEERMEEVSAILDSELERVRTELVSPEELAEARGEIISAALSRRQTARGRAFELGEALMASGDPSFADIWLERLQAVTPDDVQRVAAQYLDPETRVTITYTAGPADEAAYANPVPLPSFATLPPPVGEVRSVLPADQREAAPSPSQPPQVATPTMVEGRLANGIEVVAVQTGNVPIATITMVVPGGSRTDPQGLAGIANMAAAIADTGVNGISEGEIAARFESLGASFAGGSGSDGSSFSLTAPVANMPQAGELAAGIVKGAIYPPREFERERLRAIDSLQVAMKDPGSIARYAARAVVYGDAPYGSHPGGTVESLSALTRDHLLIYRQRFIHPARMSVVVSGGMEPEAAIALVEDMLGDWQTPLRPAPIAQDPAGDVLPVRTIVIDVPEAGQAAVLAAVRAPARDHPDYFAVELANAVLGGGSSGRLFEEVRTKRALSYGAYSGFGERADDAILTAFAQTKNESAGEVARIFLGEFERMASEPLTEDLIERRRAYLTGRQARALEASSGFNRVVAEALLQGLGADEAVRFGERLEALTPEDASTAASAYLDPDKVTLIVVGDAAQFMDELSGLRENIEVITLRDLDLASLGMESAAALSDQ